MPTRHPYSLARIALFLFAFSLTAGTGFASTPQAPVQSVILAGPSDASEKLLNSLQDASLSDSQSQLLDLSFDIASAIPAKPHAKTRSFRQQKVFDACLQLDQPARAARYLHAIDNWRRGAAYGDLSLYLLNHHTSQDVQPLLDEATRIAETADQDWRKDAVLNRVVQARVWQGRLEEARKLDAALEESEQGGVATALAATVDEKTFDDQLSQLASVVASANMESVKNAMDAYQQLFKSYFKDDKRRTQIEEKLRTASNGLPLFMRIDAMLNLAEFCAQTGDKTGGLKFVNEARDLIASTSWPVDYFIPLLGRLATVRARCGDIEGAIKEAGKALTSFEKDQEQIQNFDQADALLPVAEAFVIIGDKEQAAGVFARVVEVGAVNPNARCRAEDLSAACLSMARLNFEPSAELWKRMKQIRAGLDHPW